MPICYCLSMSIEAPGPLRSIARFHSAACASQIPTDASQSYFCTKLKCSSQHKPNGTAV